MAGLSSLTLVATLICLSVVAVRGLSPPGPVKCPIEGQIYYNISVCAPCDGTCENPVVVCPAICRAGCACPAGQVIKDGKKCVNKAECRRPPVCPVRGQIYYPECAPCDGTCRNPNPPCPLICKPGCACPRGQVIKDRKACVNKTECAVCPIEGQIYYPDCAPCDGTCENPVVPCPRICRPGCGCPAGQVIKDGKKCVDKTECRRPPVCPIKGQIYYPECAPCDGTCKNPNPVCPLVCKPGCACPRGKVIKKGKKCVKPKRCKKTG